MLDRPGKLKRVEWVSWECLEVEAVRLIFTPPPLGKLQSYYEKTRAQ